MRDHHSLRRRVSPALGPSRHRLCPICQLTMAAKPNCQRCCSTRCAAVWKRSKRSDAKPPRFDEIQGRRPAIEDPADLNAQDALWKGRGAYWESIAESFVAADRSVGMTLAGHGSLVRVDGNALVVRQGFTHYPQARREVRFVPLDRALPARIVLLACDGAITMPALAWLSHQQIPLILLDRRGNIEATFTNNFDTAANPELRARLQGIEPQMALALAKRLISKKLAQQRQSVMRFPNLVSRMVTNELIRREEDVTHRAASIEEVRLAEARAAVAYFGLWLRLPMRWKGLNSRPVPAEWLSVGVRSSILGKANRNATHPMNAMLNYSYAVLQSQVTIAAVKAGLDPSAGILHARRPGRPSLVFDLMEPLRPLVDAHVVNFLQSHVFARADFPIGVDGVVRLHPQLARVVSSLKIANHLVIQTVESFISEVTSRGETNAFGK